MAIEDEYRHTFTNVQVRASNGNTLTKSEVDIIDETSMLTNTQSIEVGYHHNHVSGIVWSPDQFNVYHPDQLYKPYTLWRHR